MSGSAIGPAVAGAWYPSDVESLRSTVDDLLAAGAEPPTSAGRVLALIEPHAGFTYSGAVAGKGFATVHRSGARRVVLLGPSHYQGFRGAALPRADAYRTPLGEVPLDREAIECLRDRPWCRITDEPFRPEHSLEAEIPFLQRALPAGWTLVPVLVGSGTTDALAEEVANALRPLLGPETLAVASSDFTHYGPRFGYVPFTDRVPERIRELDLGAVKRIEAADVTGFVSYVDRTGATICGRYAIEVLLRMLPKDARASLVAYDTSGRMTDDWDHSVSYASLAFRRPEQAAG